MKFAMMNVEKAIAAAGAIAAITAAAVLIAVGQSQDQTWSAASAMQPTQVVNLTDARREASLVRVSRSRSDLRQAETAHKAAGEDAERRAAAHQEDHDRPDRATQSRTAPVVTALKGNGAAAPVITPAKAVRASSSGSSRAGRGALAQAPDHAGKPYKWGATGPDTFDCSGFTQYLFARQGAELPRVSRDQYAASSKVSKDAKEPGDLIFTYGDGGIYHVGIYAGGNSMWAATKSGDVVRQQEIWSAQYYVGRFS